MQRLTPLSLVVIPVVMALSYSSVGAADPICQNADSDSDGDGWGWENHRSCVVDGSSASAAVASVPAQSTGQTAGQSSSQTSLSQNPVCSSAAVDSDGDGWGWENNTSCVVTDASSAPAATPVQPQAVTSTPSAADAQTPAQASSNPDVVNGLYRGTHPICSSPSADIDGDGWGFEFHTSCKVVAGYVDPNASPITPPDGNNPNNKVGVIYSQDFSGSGSGLYQADQLNDDWLSPHWHLGFDQGRVQIVNTGGSNGNAMEVTYPAGRYGAGGAAAFLSDVQFGMGLPKTYEELYVAYDIRFAEGFDFVKGGKLPGLCGSDVNQSPQTGCNTGGGYPTGYDGWSARGMWRADGELENYVYHASQRNYYGDDEFWNVSATPGVWHRVQHRVVLNTPGQRNGILEAWFDGTKVLSRNNLEFRKTREIGINLFYFSTFFGGNDASWAPSTDQTMHFDNFRLSTGMIN